MRICEIFANTIQAEGPFIGVPAIFIRTAGCVFPYCEFCDTKYSWVKGKEMNVRRIRHKIKKYGEKLVVITGGEPFLQHDIYELIGELVFYGYEVQIETSGKCEVERLSDTGVTVVCSPKQYNGYFIVKQSAIDNSDYFKFVVETQKEMVAVNYFIKRKHINRNLCYIMPKGATREEQIKIMPQIVKWCYKYNIKMSPRLHILIWDKKRGV